MYNGVFSYSRSPCCYLVFSFLSCFVFFLTSQQQVADLLPALKDLTDQRTGTSTLVHCSRHAAFLQYGPSPSSHFTHHLLPSCPCRLVFLVWLLMCSCGTAFPCHHSRFPNTSTPEPGGVGIRLMARRHLGAGYSEIGLTSHSWQ